MTKLYLKVISGILGVLAIWASMMIFDYNRVFFSRKKPVFCVSFTDRADANMYYGLGYQFMIGERNGEFIQIDFENIIGVGIYEAYRFETEA